MVQTRSNAAHQPAPKGAGALGPSAHVDTLTRDNQRVDSSIRQRDAGAMQDSKPSNAERLT